MANIHLLPQLSKKVSESTMQRLASYAGPQHPRTAKRYRTRHPALPWCLYYQAKRESISTGATLLESVQWFAISKLNPVQRHGAQKDP